MKQNHRGMIGKMKILAKSFTNVSINNRTNIAFCHLSMDWIPFLFFKEFNVELLAIDTNEGKIKESIDRYFFS